MMKYCLIHHLKGQALVFCYAHNIAFVDGVTCMNTFSIHIGPSYLRQYDIFASSCAIKSRVSPDLKYIQVFLMNRHPTLILHGLFTPWPFIKQSMEDISCFCFKSYVVATHCISINYVPE